MERAVLSPGVRRLLGALLPLLLLNGCSSMSNTDKGVVAGGALGAGAGALIGSATHHAGVGALAGGALGAVAGGLTGHAIDESDKKTDAKIAAAQAQQARQIGMTDVIQLVQQHVSDELIINQIRTTGSVFVLSAADLNMLKENGVSDRVIAEMQATAGRTPQRVYVRQAPVYMQPAPVVVVEQPPPPPPGIAVGVGFSSRH